MKKTLIIGGSYFLGRVFTMISCGKYELTLLNRGRYSMVQYGVREIKCDRRDEKALSEKIRDESFPLRDGPGNDEGSRYAYKKKLLENELREAAERSGKQYVMLRPAFIYGPYNYAPREYSYIERIVKGREILIPEDADGHFQMVYVKDVSEAVGIAIDNEMKDHAYLLAAPKVFDYELFVQTLAAASGRDCRIRKAPFAELSEKRIILPYPLRAAENELFDGSGFSDETGFTYSDPSESLAKTYKAFAGVFK